MTAAVTGRPNLPLIYVGSPPRSGSTYLKYLLTENYTHGKIHVEKTHSRDTIIEAAESSLEYNSFFFPVRNARDILKSAVIWNFQDSNNIDNLVWMSLEEITIIWETVLSAPNQFFIIDFNTLANSELTLLDKIDEKFEFLKKIRYEKPMPLSSIKNLLETHSLLDLGTDLYANRGHLPRQESEHVKAVNDEIASPVYKKRLDYLDSLQVELLERKSA